ncbi:MAG TPA: D-aminoacyl-tRNA deacylase [Trueperaceae bacterium]
MRALLQRVAWAKVEVEGRTVGEIGPGLLILLGVAHGDGTAEAARMAAKTAKLRIFGDEHGKMNLSVRDIGGGVLAVSQFTLYADTRRGNRPGFTCAAPPEEAEALYETFKAELAGLGVPPAAGIFGADMKVSLLNDGPVTILLDTAEW